MNCEHHPRTAILRQWLAPQDWAWLKQRAGVTDDRPIILLVINSQTEREVRQRIRRTLNPSDCEDPSPTISARKP